LPPENYHVYSDIGELRIYKKDGTIIDYDGSVINPDGTVHPPPQKIENKGIIMSYPKDYIEDPEDEFGDEEPDRDKFLAGLTTEERALADKRIGRFSWKECALIPCDENGNMLWKPSEKKSDPDSPSC
jgi:hypothetical protein